MKNLKLALNIFTFSLAAFAAVIATKTTAAIKNSPTFADFVWIKYDCNNADQVELVASGINFQETDGDLSYTGIFSTCAGDFNPCAIKFPKSQTTLSPDGRNRIPNVSSQGLQYILCTLP